MQKLLWILLAVIMTAALNAQDPEPYVFKDVKRLACTPVKNQEQTGTCWCFSATSFLESELLRMGHAEANLSEMFTVRHMYRVKCENYVRRQGSARLSEGGLAHDVLNAIQLYGIVPEDVYPGRKDPSKPYNHSGLEAELKKVCNNFVEAAQKGKLQENWLATIDSILDAEFGKVPQTFDVKGTMFTPLSYRDYLGLNTADYVSITSFTHHPFWAPFILEVPDNFAHGQFYNLPLGELMRCLNYSLQQGYTVEWDADVSNRDFAAKYGLAIVPNIDWKDKNDAQRQNTFKYKEREKSVSQEYRQTLFDRQETQDDHLMHIAGIVNDDDANIFYAVKNSWGEISDLKGYVNVSEAYMRLNTISFTVHKKALPVDIRRRLGLEAGDVTIDATTPPRSPNPAQREKLQQERQQPKMKPLPKGTPPRDQKQ